MPPPTPRPQCLDNKKWGKSGVVKPSTDGSGWMVWVGWFGFGWFGWFGENNSGEIHQLMVWFVGLGPGGLGF